MPWVLFYVYDKRCIHDGLFFTAISGRTSAGCRTSVAATDCYKKMKSIPLVLDELDQIILVEVVVATYLGRYVDTSVFATN